VDRRAKKSFLAAQQPDSPLPTSPLGNGLEYERRGQQYFADRDKGTSTVSPQGTTIDTSFDGALVPHAFRPRSRTKYVPGAALAVKDVNVVPVSATTIFVPPEKLPASTTYDVGNPAEAPQINVTVEPAPLNLRPNGAPGGPVHGPPPPTTNRISLDGGLGPKVLVARTRTKYRPAGTLPTENDVATLSVEKLAKSLRLDADPASMRYAAG
jgi:hypothetical protein